MALVNNTFQEERKKEGREIIDDSTWIVESKTDFSYVIKSGLLEKSITEIEEIYRLASIPLPKLSYQTEEN